MHSVDQCLLICARRQERLLPATVVGEALDERVAEIEGSEARTVGRAERRRLREEIMLELLPRAFTRSRRILAYIDARTGWLVVDTASEKVAEELVSLLRETLGSLPAVPPKPGSSPTPRMTEWVSQGAWPDGFTLGDACELRDPKDNQSVIRCRGLDLSGEEIAGHLAAGKEVVQLALSWAEQLDFVLGEDLSMKRLRFADGLLEEAAASDEEDSVVRLEAELAILVGAIRGALDGLAVALSLGHPDNASPLPLSSGAATASTRSL